MSKSCMFLTLPFIYILEMTYRDLALLAHRTLISVFMAYWTSTAVIQRVTILAMVSVTL